LKLRLPFIRHLIIHEDSKGVGETATVKSPQAVVNAVIDALSDLVATGIDMSPTLRQDLKDTERKRGRKVARKKNVNIV
jgi:hypothetical protein